MLLVTPSPVNLSLVTLVALWIRPQVKHKMCLTGRCVFQCFQCILLKMRMGRYSHSSKNKKCCLCKFSNYCMWGELFVMSQKYIKIKGVLKYLGWEFYDSYKPSSSTYSPPSKSNAPSYRVWYGGKAVPVPPISQTTFITTTPWPVSKTTRQGLWRNQTQKSLPATTWITDLLLGCVMIMFQVHRL